MKVPADGRLAVVNLILPHGSLARRLEHAEGRDRILAVSCARSVT
jgi:hypothetical protein